jgi:formate-dependent nitrite reductase cytochrome c552 subunit
MSCHNAENYDSLRRADGQEVSFGRVMDLCAQCHGPQFRDYTHGAHGGMNGHWDLRSGPRTRNNCIDCHDPHAPAYPKVMPVFPPKDAVPHS